MIIFNFPPYEERGSLFAPACCLDVINNVRHMAHALLGEKDKLCLQRV